MRRRRAFNVNSSNRPLMTTMMMMVIVMSCQQLNVYHLVIIINFDGERVCSPNGVLTSFSCMPLLMVHCYLLNTTLCPFGAWQRTGAHLNCSITHWTRKRCIKHPIWDTVRCTYYVCGGGELSFIILWLPVISHAIIRKVQRDYSQRQGN